MNFLAHLLLSKTDEQVMVGNFIGDFVKGNSLDSYTSRIRKGIRLHRAIDEFTDQHAVVLESKKRLRADFRHYAPVIVDVFYDHFVAKDWNKYTTEPLLDFTIRFYQLMDKYQSQIPEAVNNMLFYMKKYNWLYNYQFIQGIDSALTGMAKRTRFDSKMEIATTYLEDYYISFQKEFNEFFPDLKRFTENFDLQ